MIPSHIKIKNGELPESPGVYFYYDAAGELLYIGKATSLKKRVGSYFQKREQGTENREQKLKDLVLKIARIDYIEMPTVIEALVLEANQIKAHRPPFNILLRDDKSFLYLTITNEKYPRPLLMRGLELERLGIDPFRATLTDKTKKKFLAVHGPYTSGSSLRKALDLIRKFIPWSDCSPPEVTGRHKACFNVHLGKCPGVCAGTISSGEYRKIIRKLMLFFDGKKGRLVSQIKKEMAAAAKAERFEEAAKLRNNLYALDHIRDVALISREDVELPYVREVREDMIDLEGRVEAYDISNISGTSAVGSMVVFEEGKPAKDKYRRFRIKTVRGANDVAMLEEVMRRRLKRTWPLPVLMVIDGGEPQVNRIRTVIASEAKQSFARGIASAFSLAMTKIPVIGIAKGFDRKQDRLVYDVNDVELARVASRGKELFQRARDEAHRFAVAYHRKLRSKSSLRGG